MVAFMLHHAGVIAFGLALEGFAVQALGAIADMDCARDPAGQLRQGQAALPAFLDLVADDLDHRIDQHGQRHVLLILTTLTRHAEYHDAQRHMDLGGRQADARRVGHGFHHVGDQAVNARILGVFDRLGRAHQHRMSHARDFQNGHRRNPLDRGE